jgi:hypothetical protein
MNVNQKSATKSVRMFLLSDELALFRQHLESESGEPIQNIELNAALMLYDLCNFLQLGDVQKDKILGNRGKKFTQDMELTNSNSSQVH